jgi:hypothetical protein
MRRLGLAESGPSRQAVRQAKGTRSTLDKVSNPRVILFAQKIADGIAYDQHRNADRSRSRRIA